MPDRQLRTCAMRKLEAKTVRSLRRMGDGEPARSRQQRMPASGLHGGERHSLPRRISDDGRHHYTGGRHNRQVHDPVEEQVVEGGGQHDGDSEREVL